MTVRIAKLSIVLGSIVGAAVIQIVLHACGPASDSDVPDAQAAPSDCQSWEYKIVISQGSQPQNTGAWEPFAATIGCTVAQVGCGGDTANAFAMTTVRRCAQ